MTDERRVTGNPLTSTLGSLPPLMPLAYASRSFATVLRSSSFPYPYAPPEVIERRVTRERQSVAFIRLLAHLLVSLVVHLTYGSVPTSDEGNEEKSRGAG